MLMTAIVVLLRLDATRMNVFSRSASELLLLSQTFLEGANGFFALLAVPAGECHLILGYNTLCIFV